MLLFSVLTNINKIPNTLHPLLKPKQTAIIILALILTQNLVLSDNCKIFTQSNISCKICLATYTYNCSIAGSKNTDGENCVEKCCQLTNMPNQFSSLCKGTNIETSNVSVASIFMIIFFVIPALICFIVCIVSCCKKYGRRRFTEHQPNITASAINLEAFNIDDLGPFYQDRTQTCSICLENDCNIRTKCGHSFHSDCLKTWVSKKQSCPLCVSKQINPILLYCTNCWKQSKMAVLREYMRPEQQVQWQLLLQKKCQLCTKDDNNDEISLNIEIQQKKDGQSNIPNQIVSIQSKQHQ